MNSESKPTLMAIHDSCYDCETSIETIITCVQLAIVAVGSPDVEDIVRVVRRHVWLNVFPLLI